MKLDFDLQVYVLNKITDVFPQTNLKEWVIELYEKHGKDHTNGNLFYLQMHGLLELEMSPFLDDIQVVWFIRPTEKAFDYLAENGGWSAILGVQIVKLHEESTKALFLQHIKHADLSPEQKTTLSETIRALPDTALKHLTTKVLDNALTQLPSIWKWLQTLL